ncbi:MAG: rod shape-determining protein MreC [Anaerolineaceae bacterium]|nr:rod shape-determining protein MreC [Anaerolineaceae bacterium]
MNRSPTRFWQTTVIFLVVAGLLFLAISGYISPLVRTATDPIIQAQRWLSVRFNAVYEILTVPQDVASLRQRNEQLEDELSGLRTKIIELEQKLRETDVLYALLDFARSRPQNKYIASAVIGRDPSPFLHYIIIDHGSDDGLRRGMPVVTEQGLVGRVDAVIANAARVQLITDPGATVNVRLQAKPVEFMMTGSVTGDLVLEMIPQDLELLPGELVLTSGLGGNYPHDIVVGQITSVRKREVDLFQTASVQPVVEFAGLRAVLVIVNFRPVDISPLLPELVP